MLFKEFVADLGITALPGARRQPRMFVFLWTGEGGSGRLQRALDSVLAQDYADVELIVIHDGSRDGSAEIMHTYQQTDARVIVHGYRHNCSLPAVRYKPGGALCRGAVLRLPER